MRYKKGDLVRIVRLDSIDEGRGYKKSSFYKIRTASNNEGDPYYGLDNFTGYLLWEDQIEHATKIVARFCGHKPQKAIKRFFQRYKIVK
jgi:hypothetical protein